MSTTKITRTFDIGGVPTDMTSVIFRDPTGTFGLIRTDTSAIVIAAGVALTHTGLGTYEYSIIDPAAGLTYDYYIEFVYAGETYNIEKTVQGGTSGSGVGTVVAKALPASCLSLPRYAEIIDLNENWFWGLNDGVNMPGACDHIWTEGERKRIARYLYEAQEELEQVIGYPLCPRWFTSERHPYSFSVFAKWGKILAVGYENSSVILASAAINYATDPAVITAPTTVIDEDEIVVYYPGSTRVIIPDDVTISGGVVTIQIPWCRLIDPSNFYNPEVGWDYNDPTIYLSTVDIYRVFNDDSIQAGLIYPHRASSGTCSCDCVPCCGTCGEYAENACEYIRRADIGIIDVLPATYVSYWTAACLTCYCSDPEYVHLNYKAGVETLTTQMEDAIIRLAHSKMPSPPCGCGTVMEMWTRDREIPEVLSPEQVNCPFGTSRGAWFAWKQALAIRLSRGMAM